MENNFQPIVMPCTKEQYESLLPVLREHRHKDNFLNGVYPILQTRYSLKSITNNHNGDTGHVSINTKSIDDSIHTYSYKRKVHKRFNRKIFLASLGIIEEKPFVLPDKWCVKVTEENVDVLNAYLLKHKSVYDGYNSNWGVEFVKTYELYFLKPTRRGVHSTIRKKGYTEITFEQFKKYALEKDISILESQPLTTNRNNTMIKATVNESLPKGKIHKGCLVKWKDIVGIVISTNLKEVTILSLSKGIGITYNVNTDIDNVSLFKGILTLEQ